MHLKGTEKRIVCMKSTDSRLFCEAFFVLREDAPAACESDMLAEANRILDEHIMRSPRKRRARALSLAVAFLVGAAVATMLFLLFVF